MKAFRAYLRAHARTIALAFFWHWAAILLLILAAHWPVQCVSQACLWRLP